MAKTWYNNMGTAPHDPARRHLSIAGKPDVPDSYMKVCMPGAGAVMGVLASGLALAFMHFHWGLKKVYLRLGLHVSLFLCPQKAH